MVGSEEVVVRRRLQKERLLAESERYRLELWGQCEHFEERMRGWIRVTSCVSTVATCWAGATVLEPVGRSLRMVSSLVGWVKRTRSGSRTGAALSTLP